MRYLLDADAVIALLNDHDLSHRAPHSSLRAPRFLGARGRHPRAVLRRVQQSADGEDVARVDALQFPVLEFDQEDARQAGEIRAHLASKGTPIGPYDVLIAGQAQTRKLTLVTHNTREFQRVAGLRVEDWKGTTSSMPAAFKSQKSSASDTERAHAARTRRHGPDPRTWSRQRPVSQP